MASLSDYIHFAAHVYCSAQGVVLARLLSLNDDHVFNENLWSCDIASTVSGKCIAILDDVLVSHLLCVKALHMRNHVEAFNYQTVHVAAVVKLLKTQIATNWMLPVMFTACSGLRVTAQTADLVNGGNGDILEQAVESMMACFDVCTNDTNVPREYSKMVGLLCPVNQVLRMYFRMNKFSSCKSIITSVQPVVIRGRFSIAQTITFRFFVGRMALVESDFRAANKHLYYAFRECHPLSYKNKRIILTYLVPVKMLLGYLPSRSLIEKYNLPLLWHLVTAVREGRIKMFEDVLVKYNRFFTNAGLFVALDNLRLVAYRNVLKKVYQTANTNTIPVEHFQAGLQLMSENNVDASETQSLIASMIYNKKIKAYLSYQHGVVIFHPYDPFPRLSTISNPGFY